MRSCTFLRRRDEYGCDVAGSAGSGACLVDRVGLRSVIQRCTTGLTRCCSGGGGAARARRGRATRKPWHARRCTGRVARDLRLRLGDGQTAARLSCFRVVCAMNPAGPSSRDSVSKTVAKSCWSTKSRLFFSSWTTDPEPRQGDGEGSVTRVVDAAPVQDVSQSESGEVRRAGRPRQSRWPCRT